jgi:hypothetical protein
MSPTPALSAWMSWRSVREALVRLMGLMHALKHGTLPET